ncbi:hypothetical protein HS088_TW04G00103 [Tripterygium wilfordii]|uniref:Transmembrane protein n=1 Tax=Tripterygium wilfordii TaxID=458696 RepID=A0A7J7DPE6_TRIWF|nr:hypothetical protein HS088_TW04G00103 [Tripterygium wilfordii]
MLCYRSLSFSLVFTFLFFSSSSYFPSTHGALHFHPLSPLPSSGSGSENGVKFVVDFPWEARRSVVEGPIGEPVEGSTLVLAPKRTYRKDPLDGFKRYTQGWNISNHHYWASVGFTAAPLFFIAALWFLGFGLCVLLVSLAVLFYMLDRGSFIGARRKHWSMS